MPDNIILKTQKLIKRMDSGFCLEAADLSIKKMGIYGLVGPNGAGKTTLLKILSLLDRPSEGKIFFKGGPVNKINLLAIRRKMSIVMENPFLFNGTVFDNVTFGLRFRKVSSKYWHRLADEALETVGLKGAKQRDVCSLSRGESQRIALARAVILNPEVLFLDEPFVNIDHQNISLIEDYIKSIRQKRQTTVIFTTHNFLQAWRMSNAIISLVNGRIIDTPLDNFFSGVCEEEDGLGFVRISKGIRIAVSGQTAAKCNVCIHPQDIVLSRLSFKSSARNLFKGRIVSIHAEGGIVRITIRIDRAVELTALITKRSFQELGVSINSEVFAAFKATAVIIF